MTDEMLEKARKNAKDYGYTNVEFRKGDIERRIPVEDNIADLVISNCVINLTADKAATFREIYKILKNDGGRMMISDMVADKEVDKDAVDPEKWCSCIDGALTKERLYPTLSLSQYVGNRLRKLKKWSFVDYEVYTNKYFLSEQKRKVHNIKT